MNVLLSVIGLLVALGILVTVHEYGHFWVARRNGIKVLRFSIGFGQPLYRWYDKQGTEFAIAWIPLGGYVKMLDEREGPVPAAEQHGEFMSKTPLQRIAVASAGPLANFLFAILAFALLYTIGVQGLKPLVDQPPTETPAAEAGFERGDRILAIDGHEVDTWREVNLTLAQRVGDSGEIEFRVARDGRERRLNVPVERWLSQESEPNPMANLGLYVQRPEVPAVIGQLMPGEAAEAAGLQVGDQVLRTEGQVIENWLDWVEVIQLNGGRSLDVEVLRDGERMTLEITPRTREVEGETQGYIGAGAASFEWPEEQIVTHRVMPWTAIAWGLRDTWEMVGLSFGMLGKMVTGQVSFEQIGGPISMAQLAGDSVQGGLESFVRYLAFISIALGVMNLLPIPILDGGHILFYSIEWLRGRPVSERMQIIATQVGLMLIIGLMMVAFYNDIGRLG
ncbi:RIP metalloprotease RseP [Saccharospirillum salsuginis]|uniref:Zinc metalloprotease n=1 Tax=Saccharospirillum salsuginis TaxID=418750 RepID=A0A918NEK6_9GAMM|nr:RIP metalloprotease RseP [Saccharospirillum salsuginis]GGX61558.1 putative zinc metalloprotease [Saccharospirillum salsuginis]